MQPATYRVRDARSEPSHSPATCVADRAQRRPWARRLALFCGFVALYLLTMPTRVPDSGDSLVEVSAVTTATEGARSNHLLQTPLMRLMVAAGRALGYHGDPLLVIQATNAVAGAAAVVCVAAIAEQFGFGVLLATAAAVLVGVSFGHWYHSREAETAMVSNLLWLLSLYRALLARGAAWVRQSIVAGCLAGASALFCLNAVVLVPVVLLVVGGSSRYRSSGQRWLAVALVLCAVAVVAGIPLLVAGSLSGSERGLAGAVRWVLSYRDTDRMDVGRLSSFTVLRSAVGLANALVGHDLRLGTSIGRKAVQALVLIAVIGLLTLSGIGVRSDRRRRLLVLISVTGLATTLGFGALWLGSDPQFWVPALPLLWLVALAGLSGQRSTRRIATGGTIACVMLLTALNWHSRVPSVLFPAGGLEYQRAAAYVVKTDPGDLLLVPGDGWGLYVSYIRPGRSRSLTWLQTGAVRSEVFLQTLEGLIRKAADEGGNVYAAGIVEAQTNPVDDPSWNQLERISGLDHGRLRHWLLEGYDVRPAFRAGDTEIWRVQRK